MVANETAFKEAGGLLVGPTHEGVVGARLLRALSGLNDSKGSPKASAMVFGAATEPPPRVCCKRSAQGFRKSLFLSCAGTTLEGQSKPVDGREEDLSKEGREGGLLVFLIGEFLSEGA